MTKEKIEAVARAMYAQESPGGDPDKLNDFGKSIGIHPDWWNYEHCARSFLAALAVANRAS